MPTPIPDWDLARRLVKFIGMKQISNKPATVREATVTIGIGRQRIEDLLDQKKVIYKIFSGSDPSGKDLIALEYVPNNLALDAGLANAELHRTFHRLVDRQQHGEIRVVPRRRRITKKQRENMKVLEFWDRTEPSHERE